MHVLRIAMPSSGRPEKISAAPLTSKASAKFGADLSARLVSDSAA